MLHEKNQDILKGLYKAALFVIQADYYQKKGVYVSKHKALGTLVEDREKEIIEQYDRMKKKRKTGFPKSIRANFCVGERNAG